MDQPTAVSAAAICNIRQPLKRRPKRIIPRPNEMQLLRHCISGPRDLSEGPVGRCTKRGWLRTIVEVIVVERKTKTVVRYELTEIGRAAVDSSESA
jgi:hypothetical protein